MLFVKKYNGIWRMCINYRAFNSVTVRNVYPLPYIIDCLNALGEAR